MLDNCTTNTTVLVAVRSRVDKKGVWALRQADASVQVAQAIISQVAGRPCLLNLSRTLAYHKRTLREEPLTLAEAEQQQHLVNDISDALRTVLCL